MLKYKLSQLNKITKKVLNQLSSKDCIFLFGELGSGKTTFTRNLIHQLQDKHKLAKTEILSPTFNILHEYEIESYKIMHYDFYRVESNKDLDQLGFYENLEKTVTIIEWPQVIKKNINDRLEVSLFYEKEDEHRKIDFKGFGKWKNFKINEI